MGMLFPIFLGGLLLVAVPFIIHHIRRPERKQVRFSSLMFVPKIKKEVVERRRLQHLLLMLLRMLILALLAFAFSRPYRVIYENKNAKTSAPEYHLLLLDDSFSMGADDNFNAAKARALEILDSIPTEARVALVSFSAAPRTLAGLEGGDAPATHLAAREALSAAQLGQGSTNYVKALRYAESLLLANLSEDAADEACVLHMFSDFRKKGMPQDLPAWRLSGRIRFIGYPVGDQDLPNRAVSDVTVRFNEDQQPRVVARLKNYESKDATLNATLKLEGKVDQHLAVTVAAGNASLVEFPLSDYKQGALKGSVSLDPDRFQGDDTRFLLWQPDPGKRVWLVGDARSQEPYGDAWFLDKALAASDAGTWQITSMDAARFVKKLQEERPPDAVILAENKAISEAAVKGVNDYVAAGGSLLVCIGSDQPALADVNRILKPLGLSSKGLRFSLAEDTRFESISWVDFDHPVFYAFRSARFNDFSTVRFNNYHLLQAPKEVHVTARIGHKDGQLMPVMLEVPRPAGKVMVWAFSVKLAWTNLPKHVKLVPILSETMAYLTRWRQQKNYYQVGESFPLSSLESDSGQFFLRGPDGQEAAYQDRAALAPLTLPQVGYLDFRTGPDQAWQSLVAVNANSDEGDPQAIPVSEFALKLTSNSQTDGLERSGDTPFVTQSQRRGEWGYWLIALLLPLILIETLYAVVLSKRRQEPGPA